MADVQVVPPPNSTVVVQQPSNTLTTVLVIGLLGALSYGAYRYVYAPSQMTYRRR